MTELSSSLPTAHPTPALKMQVQQSLSLEWCQCFVETGQDKIWKQTEPGYRAQITQIQTPSPPGLLGFKHKQPSLKSHGMKLMVEPSVVAHAFNPRT